MKNRAFLGLGSNIGNKFKNITNAIELIKSNPKINVLKQSSIYETPPVGYTDQDFFLNCVIEIETSLDANQLLFFLQKVEKELGRKKTFKWGPRNIDLDILFFNDEIIDSQNLTVPHPYLHERGFVLIPFIEINKNFIHPIKNKTIYDLYLNLSDDDKFGIKKYKEAHDEIFY